MSAQFESYPDERRRSPRINGAEIKVEYFTEKNKASAVHTSVKDVCIHGICLFMPDIIEVNETISMKISLAGSETPIAAQGVIVWFSAGDRSGCYNVGIEFEKISEEDQMKLSDYIKAHLEGS